MKKLEWLQAIIAPFIGFFLILFGLNGYQYLKVKSDFTSSIASEIGAAGVQQVEAFFSEVTENLLLIRDWGKNDVLFEDDLANLNRKLIPVLERLPQITGVVMANSDGREYFLFKEGVNYTGRVLGGSGSENGIREMHFTKWSADFTELKIWQDHRSYDPRDRVWFKIAKDDPGDSVVHWAGPYTFFHSGQTGITASVSWRDEKKPDRLLVIGFDVPLASIEQLLVQKEMEQPGWLFVTSEDGSKVISGAADKTNKSTDQSNQKINDTLLSQILEQWMNQGEKQELVRVRANNREWLVFFSKINVAANSQNAGDNYWLGHVIPERELSGLLSQTLFQIDWIEIAIAFCGAVILLLVMRKTGWVRRRDKPLEETVSQRLLACIQAGEGEIVEFKSTVRTNLKSGKVGKEIELAWLKAVTAFLNSNGGTLLIGVNDSGEVCGIEADKFDSPDKSLLHVKNLLNQHIGAEFSAFLNISLVDFEEKEVFMIECQSAGSAVFLKIGKNEEFYVRSGPSSVKLSPSQMVSYLQKKT